MKILLKTFRNSYLLQISAVFFLQEKKNKFELDSFSPPSHILKKKNFQPDFSYEFQINKPNVVFFLEPPLHLHHEGKNVNLFMTLIGQLIMTDA